MIGIIILSKVVVLYTVLDQFVFFIFNHFILHSDDFFVGFLQLTKL